MKKILFAALAATTLFASCAKEGNGPEVVTGSPAKMTISFNNPADTRAFDATSETEIKNATAFVLTADGAIMSKFFIPTADINTAKEYEVTTAANKVVVIANKDLSATTSTTLTALKEEVATLESLNGANGFFASGTSAVLNWETAGVSTTDPDSKLATATVTMKLLPARLDVKINNNMDNYSTTASKGLVLNDVAVLYSAGFSHWIAATENGTDFYPATATITAISGAKYFRSGFNGWDSEEDAQNTVLAGLCKSWILPASTQYNETFYVYPTLPDAAAYGRDIILVVRATWKGADGTLSPTEPRYFPVHFNTTDVGELVSGKKYTVTINLNGDAGAGGGSVTDPGTPVVPAYLSVSVSIAPWEAVTITKEFE